MQGKKICCMDTSSGKYIQCIHVQGLEELIAWGNATRRMILDPCHVWIAETLLLYNDVLLLYFSYECNRPEYGSQHVFQVWLVELLHVDISSVPEMFTIVMLASINAQLRATVWKEWSMRASPTLYLCSNQCMYPFSAVCSFPIPFAWHFAHSTKLTCVQEHSQQMWRISPSCWIQVHDGLIIIVRCSRINIRAFGTHLERHVTLTTAIHRILRQELSNQKQSEWSAYLWRPLYSLVLRISSGKTQYHFL